MNQLRGDIQVVFIVCHSLKMKSVPPA
jgi:hypothetical protein